jgi:hypothetical protein
MSCVPLRQRLERVKSALAVPGIPPPAAPAPPSDAREVAAELAASFGRLRESYLNCYTLTPQEATAEVTAGRPHRLAQVLEGPPEQVDWSHLEALAERDPVEALRRWEAIKEAARSELRTGHRAARALEPGGGSCWERAGFLAIRAELTEAWQPRNALEQQLLDQMAHLQTLLERWQQILVVRTRVSVMPRPAGAGESHYQTPRLSDAEALAEAAGMVERLHRLYLRTLRALQDQRRLQPPVVVRRAAQVNVAHQQINLAASP